MKKCFTGTRTNVPLKQKLKKMFIETFRRKNKEKSTNWAIFLFFKIIFTIVTE